MGLLLLLPSTRSVPALLDTYSGAAAAYSVRKVRTAYTGPCIRVRRSSDNAEQDIGFLSNGILDTLTLASFVASNNGLVTTVYDQTGNGNHLTQTTALAQPMIVNTGTVLTKNGRPAIDFTASHWMQSTITGLSDATNLTNFSVIAPALASLADGDTSHVFSTASGGGSSSERGSTVGSVATSMIAGETLCVSFSNASLNAGRVGSSSYSHSAGQQLLFSSLLLSTGTQVFKNASSVTLNLSAIITTATNTSPSNDANTSSVFRINAILGTVGIVNEMIQESIVYLSDQSANRAAIESAINSFYSVY